MLVSRGHDERGRTDGTKPDDEATLLTTARISVWKEVKLPSTMKQAQFEAFVRAQGKAAGLSDSDAWPFVVKGSYPSVLWHVVTAATGAGNQHGGAPAGAMGHGAKADNQSPGHAQTRVFDEKSVNGMLVGFYSGDKLEGVISHAGERFHVHFSNVDLTRSGHVDGYEVAQGAVLLLPVR